MAGDAELTLVEFGPLHAHAVSMAQAVDLIARRAASGRGGFVLTPNLDHVARGLVDAEWRAAYQRAFLSLADGMPLVAISRLLGLSLREKVSGSDLFEPLMARCAADGLPVFVVGASAAVCEAAFAKLRARHANIRLVGFDASLFDLDNQPATAAAALRRARASGARIVLASVPPAKQLRLHRFEDEYRPAVGIGAGSTLAFYAGAVRRAPRFVSRIGVEWLYRLCQEPRRLWRRYLLEDPKALAVLARMVLDRLRGRPLERPCRLALDPVAPAPP
jgi:N-acetylglucosaminyldiphosphoundecaprenol N-acetyl-beta-D-mannosaminyltransferase